MRLNALAMPDTLLQNRVKKTSSLSSSAPRFAGKYQDGYVMGLSVAAIVMSTWAGLTALTMPTSPKQGATQAEVHEFKTRKAKHEGKLQEDIFGAGFFASLALFRSLFGLKKDDEDETTASQKEKPSGIGPNDCN